MCDVLNTKDLLRIRNQFLCCVPIYNIDFKDSILFLSWEQQEFLLNQTIKSDLVKKYPLKSSYQKIFLKTLINILEENCIEIHDNICDSYCDILNSSDTETYYYKHYIINDKAISLKENKNFISEGTTGLCSWQASLALAQWCLNNKQKLESKKILELGSGIGLTGLTIALHCQPKELYLTDCHPKVLTVLSENVSLNLNELLNQTDIASEKFDSVAKNSDFSVSSKNSSVSSKNSSVSSKNNSVSSKNNLFSSKNNSVSSKNSSVLPGKPIKLDSNLVECDNIKNTVSNDENVILSVSNKGSKIYVVNLAWESVEENSFWDNINPDLILAADVVYDNSVFKPLCETVKYFLGRNTESEVVFACTERNSETLQEFLAVLESNNLKIAQLQTPEQKDFYWSTADPIRFFLVTAE